MSLNHQNLNHRNRTYYEENGREVIGSAFEKRFKALLLVVPLCLISAVMLIEAYPLLVIPVTGLISITMIVSMIKEIKRYTHIQDGHMQVLGAGIVVERMGRERDFVFGQVRVNYRGKVEVAKVPIYIFRKLRIDDSIMLIQIGDTHYAVPMKYSDYA